MNTVEIPNVPDHRLEDLLQMLKDHGIEDILVWEDILSPEDGEDLEEVIKRIEDEE